MRKGYFLLVAVLLACVACTIAVYQFYVKERLKELGEHEKEEDKLRTKIQELEDTFYRTKPEVVLTEWREKTQPWADAVDRRSEFFNLGETPVQIEIPEEKIPKFYYPEEYKKLEDGLYAYADEKGCSLGNLVFRNIRPPDSLRGQNPSPAQVSGWLTRYGFGASATRLVIDSGATNIIQLEVWPPRKVMPGRSGTVVLRTIGTRILISNENLVKFMEEMRSSDRYFSIEAIKITNNTLRDAQAELNVEMILSQARFVAAVRAGDSSSVSAIAGNPADLGSFMQQLFQRDPNAPMTRSDDVSWWQRFRKKFIPF